MDKEELSSIISVYEKLKDEQLKRIEFRDHMVYLTLAAIGGVFSFALTNTNYTTALLVLPFIIFVLGWMYVNNDEKISAIGTYCKDEIIPKLTSIKSWEEHNRNADRRKERKVIQLITDWSVFCFSGLFSLVCYYHLSSEINWVHIVVFGVEILTILFLAYQIYSYSDFNKNED